MSTRRLTAQTVALVPARENEAHVRTHSPVTSQDTSVGAHDDLNSVRVLFVHHILTKEQLCAMVPLEQVKQARD